MWVAISQVETARTPPAYSGHLQCSAYCCVAISHCLCRQRLSLSVALLPCNCLQALLGRTHLDLRVTGSCLDASSSAPQIPVCAACSFLLLPLTQTDLQTLCLSFVSDFLSELNLKKRDLCLNKHLVAYVSVSLAKRLPSHDSSKVITVRNHRNLHQVSPKTTEISNNLYQIHQWAVAEDRLALKQNLPCWLH